MKAFIYVGGRIYRDNITSFPEEGDLVIAADSGLRNARSLGVTPTKVVGDLDSLPESEIPKGAELIRLKPEKDVTDTQAAVELAVELGADRIEIIGGLSGRLDHTLANLSVLEDLTRRGIYATACDGGQRVRFVNSSSVLVGKGGYKYLSVVAVDEKLKGVEIDGCKYNLNNGTVPRRLQYAVSNEIEGNCALVYVKKGAYYLIESRDCQ